MNARVLHALVIAIFAVWFSACGGSGSDDDDPPTVIPPPPPPVELDPNGETVLSSTHRPTLVGIVIDSLLINLRFGVSQATNERGEFTYQPGVLVTFRVGDIALPPVQGAPVVTVFDISNAAVNPVRYINIARFLQTLDDDGDVSNGIRVSDISHTVATGQTLDFDLPPDQFEATANLLVAAINTAGGTANTQLIDSTTADSNARAALNALPKISPISGTYRTGTDDSLQVAVFLDNNTYFLLEGNCGGAPVYEYGSFSFDAGTNQFTTTVIDDHGGAGCGLNNATYSVGFGGADVVFDGATWQPEPAVAGTINGTYVGGNFTGASVGELAMHVFLSNGEYIELIDCDETHGMEAGRYSWNSVTNELTVSSVLESNPACFGTSSLQPPVTAITSGQTIEVQDASSEYNFDLLVPSQIGGSLTGAWDSGDVVNGGVLVFTSTGEIQIVWNCDDQSGSDHAIGNYVWDSATGDARISITQNGEGNCGLMQFADSIRRLEVSGNMLNIVTDSLDQGTISVGRLTFNNGLEGTWTRAADGGFSAMTLIIYRDSSNVWNTVVTANDCSIDTTVESAEFDFDAPTWTITNVASFSDVPACGLPTTFGPSVVLNGDTLTVDGLGQFERVK